MKQNYFSFKKLNEEYLLTNERGEFCFLSETAFHSLITQKYDEIEKAVLEELQQKDFIFDIDEVVFVESVMNKYRDMHSYLFDATSLHILVMTNACNMNCIYCQAQNTEQKIKGKMTLDTAMKAVEIALQSPSKSLVFEFQGGEPLLDFDVIKGTIEYAKAHTDDKNVSFSIVTNTLLISDEMISFCRDNDVSISTSLDGNAYIHDQNRSLLNGNGTHKLVTDNIKRLRKNGISVGAIQTTTRQGLSKAKELVDEYLTLGMDRIFVRPLTPVGYAKENWKKIGYSAEEFLAFYRDVIAEMLNYGAHGKIISEGHADIFLRKILGKNPDNYMELRSPCGAGVGQIAYYYNGDVFTCDEGRMLYEMGLDDFKMGTVEDSYDSLMESDACKITCQASVLESLPECADCPYHIYCGVCPVINYAMNGSIYPHCANDYKCRIYKGMLDILFGYIQKNGAEKEILCKWIQ